MPKILLTGTPESSALQWTDDVLSNALLPAFSPESEACSSRQERTGRCPVWRQARLGDEVLRTGLTPGDLDWGGDAADVERFEYSFIKGGKLSILGLSVDALSSGDERIEDDKVTKYYSHSLFAHEALPSSQIVAAEDLGDPDASFATSILTSTSFDLDSLNETTATSGTEVYPKPVPVPIRDLRNLPTLNYLYSIKPRRMTINLIVAIVSIPPPRQLVTRYGKRRVDLLEMIVSDDTKSGFGINLWLPPLNELQTDAKASPLLRLAASKLRPRDVVLVRNLELSVYEKRIYGQNLRRDRTKLHLLYRDRLDRYDERGAYGRAELDGAGEDDRQLAKVRRVRDWVVDFGPVSINRRHEVGSILESLPPDTTTEEESASSLPSAC